MAEQSKGFAWRTSFELGERDVDDAHRHLVSALDALLRASDAALLAALQLFEMHAIEHFAAEDRMIEPGYPVGDCHRDEHRAVLASVSQVKARLCDGDHQLARRLAAELARWFPEHVEVMDHGLVAWHQQRRLGGAKIALVRPTVADPEHVHEHAPVRSTQRAPGRPAG